MSEELCRLSSNLGIYKQLLRRDQEQIRPWLFRTTIFFSRPILLRLLCIHWFPDPSYEIWNRIQRIKEHLPEIAAQVGVGLELQGTIEFNTRGTGLDTKGLITITKVGEKTRKHPFFSPLKVERWGELSGILLGIVQII